MFSDIILNMNANTLSMAGVVREQIDAQLESSRASSERSQAQLRKAIAVLSLSKLITRVFDEKNDSLTKPVLVVPRREMRDFIPKNFRLARLLRGPRQAETHPPVAHEAAETRGIWLFTALRTERRQPETRYGRVIKDFRTYTTRSLVFTPDLHFATRSHALSSYYTENGVGYRAINDLIVPHSDGVIYLQRQDLQPIYALSDPIQALDALADEVNCVMNGDRHITDLRATVEEDGGIAFGRAKLATM